MQTAETYKQFIGTSEISFGGNNFEIYFEEDDFDKSAYSPLRRHETKNSYLKRNGRSDKIFFSLKHEPGR